MAPRKKCPICGSKQWRKDSASGLVTCSDGHVRQNYRTESGEATDFGAQTMKKRTLKANRKKKEKASKADPKLYHGERARFHYYQCMQLLLRKQIATLIALWNLPSEFEVICRDLWALHLDLVPNPPQPEPLYHAQELEGRSDVPGDSRSLHRMHSDHDGQIAKKRPKNTTATNSPSSSSSDDDEILDSELEALLQENSEPGLTDEEPSDDEGSRSSRRIKPSNPFVSRADKPENTIAVLVLACWFIRLPVVYMDFISVIESYSLPFLDHVRFLPSALTRHLTKHAVQALSPRHAPRTSSLHRTTSRLANRLYGTFDISTPELNAAPVLWRVVRYLRGTPMLYSMTKRLSHVLSLPLTVHRSLAPSLSSIQRGDTESQRYDNVAPEIALISVAIMVLKLVYGLDGKKRLPRHPEDVACIFPNADEYLADVKEASDAETCVNSYRFSSRTPLSVGDLDDATLDEYLDFCQRALVGSQDEGHRILDSYFPLTNRNAAVTPSGLMADLKAKRLPSTTENVHDVDILEPGESYTIYHSGDVLGSLAPELDLVVQKSARWTGVSCDVICGVVERYERRLVRWWNGERESECGV
ncbi:hypothetical protein F5I97DRAFT_2010694 [Phlebopus sp. FC_14]|nr:hypothetical protein F5I97DRAFT_2010694 [Phlebopus sp. FC_14]